MPNNLEQMGMDKCGYCGHYIGMMAKGTEECPRCGTAFEDVPPVKAERPPETTGYDPLDHNAYHEGRKPKADDVPTTDAEDSDGCLCPDC